MGLELKLRALHIAQKSCQNSQKNCNCLQESVFLKNASKRAGGKVCQMKQLVFQMKQFD